jgi:hypothetical protein
LAETITAVATKEPKELKENFPVIYVWLMSLRSVLLWRNWIRIHPDADGGATPSSRHTGNSGGRRIVTANDGAACPQDALSLSNGRAGSCKWADWTFPDTRKKSKIQVDKNTAPGRTTSC